MTMAADPLFRGHWLVRCVSWVRGLGPGVRRWDGHHPFSVQLFAGTAGSAHGRSRGSPGRAQRLGWSQREPNLWPRTKAPGLVCPQKRDYLAALATLSGGLDDAGGEASLLAVARHMLVHKHWLSDAAPPPTRPSPRQQRTAWPDPALAMAPRRIRVYKGPCALGVASRLAGPAVRPFGTRSCLAR